MATNANAERPKENSIDLRGDYVDNILYWAVRMWIEETVIPESTDKICEQMIQEYVLESE